MLVLLTSCANPLNQATYDRYFAQGREALHKGDLQVAEMAYYRALVNARVGHLGPAAEGASAYNLGLVKRSLCKPHEAEDLLRHALQLEETAPQPNSELMSKRLLELARLHYDRGQYSDTVNLIGRWLPVSAELGVEKSYPVDQADILEHYANALHKVGRADEAKKAEVHAKSLRSGEDAAAKQRSMKDDYFYPPEKFIWKEVTRIPVGKDPTGVAVGAGAVWVALMEENSVIRIDPKELQTIGQSILVGKQPSGVAITEDSLWVANMGEATVSRVALQTGKVLATIPVGNGPRQITAGAGAIWVSNFDDGTVSKIDPRLNQVVTTVKIGEHAKGLVIEDGILWVATNTSIVRVDLTSNQLVGKPINMENIQGIDFGGGAVWAADLQAAVLNRIDARTSQVVAQIPVSRRPSVVLVRKEIVWVTNYSDHTVSRIDTHTNKVIGKPIRVGIGPVFFAFGDHTLWVASRCSESLSRINVEALGPP